MAISTASRPIPVTRGLPVLGSAHELLRDPAAFLVRSYREHGPVFRAKALGRSITVLAGPALPRFMSSREGQASLRSKEIWDGMVSEYDASRILVGLDGPEHKRLREVMRFGYSREALSGRLDELVAITDRSIARDFRPGTRVPVVGALQLMVTDQLGTLLTGAATLDYVADVRTTILNILNVYVTRQRPPVLLRLPRYRKAKARFLELADQVIEQARRRTGEDGPGPSPRMLIDDLMAAHDRDPELLPTQDLPAAVTGPYVAGLDTVANTVGSLLYTVLKHPDVLARIRAEAAELFEADGPLPDDAVERLPTVHAALMKTMRLYPIAVVQPRVAARDFEFEGYLIPEGEVVYCAVTVPHFLEEYFPDPMRFDLDRYAKPRQEQAKPGAYNPFGRGPHTCLGKGLADVQMTLTAARLFHRLDLSLPSPDYVLRRKAAPTPGPSMRFEVRVDALRN
jgi:cytochrome P450